MSERAAPAAALVAAVVLGGTVAGGLLAAALRDDGDPSDADVAAALANAGLGDDELRCALAVLADDEPLVGPPPEVCSGLSSSTTVAVSTSTTEGPLPDCTGASGADAAAVEVCAVDGLVALLTNGTDLDAATAACAAQAVVDELGVEVVIAALDSGVPPADLRDRLQAAFASC